MSLLLNHPVLTIRLFAGVNAASILAGFAGLMKSPFFDLTALAAEKFPALNTAVRLEDTSVNGVAGLTVAIDAPKPAGHVHRSIPDIARMMDDSTLTPAARTVADRIWSVLAAAEASVHNASPDTVHFHEVGRTANVVAIGLIAELFNTLAPETFAVSPVPLTDGIVHCAHGAVPNPAPSLFAMLKDIPVTAFAGTGEAVTPTGLAILKGLGAQFGPWPTMTVRKNLTAYAPGKVFVGAPNGLLFALGEAI